MLSPWTFNLLGLVAIVVVSEKFGDFFGPVHSGSEFGRQRNVDRYQEMNLLHQRNSGRTVEEALLALIPWTFNRCWEALIDLT